MVDCQTRVFQVSFRKKLEERQNPVPKVLVMMATYNGAEYLRDQIDSILHQRQVEVALRICDDCSSDETASILEEYVNKGAPIIATSNSMNLGYAKNFMQMIYDTDINAFDYFAFSDQDDYWMPEKLITAVNEIRVMENGDESKNLQDIGTPVLYCSELLNVNQDLENPVLELNKLDDMRAYRAAPLIWNVYSGCTMVFNRAQILLVRLTNYDDLEIRAHDSWMYLLSYYCGNYIVDLEHALILRRNTGNNTRGRIARGKGVKEASIFRLVKSPKREASKSARLLLKVYGGMMTDQDRKLVKSFCAYASTFSGRLRWAFSNQYRAPSCSETLLARVKLFFGRY